jgi:hypothetical protein
VAIFDVNAQRKEKRREENLDHRDLLADYDFKITK